ncbi:MAG: serine/threonine-protein kinase [Hyphomicrobiaceae bacterium]
MRLLEEGSVIRGTYEVERFLGEGGFAEVYRVKHRFLGRQAMKVFKTPSITLDEAHRMLGEAILLSRIGHPNIVRVFDADLVGTSYGECAYFTMEHVAGGTLEDFWKSYGAASVPVETSVELLRQVCRGLAVAHSYTPPIVHRDIKPQNILVGYDTGGLRARISDFGLAKHVNPLTLLLSAQGTRRFKAPEVFRNPQADSCAGDVWALGCVLYLLVTDRLPYEGVPGWELEMPDFTARDLVPPSRLNYRVDIELDRILCQALAIEPTRRHASAQRLLVDLEAWHPPERSPIAPSGTADSPNLGKSALGPLRDADEAGAQRLADEAIRLTRFPGKLNEAADLMEDAFKKSPALRDRYEYQIQLWRKGVVM